VNAPEPQRLDPVPEGVGQAPLVDFCNQHNPRARPRDHPNPGPRVGGCPLLRSCAPRRDRNLVEPGVRLRAPLVPDVRLRAHLEYATGWRRASARDEPCGPLLLQNGSSRGFTGQGPDGFRHPAPLAAIPRGESFAPTRSARTPRVVSSWRHRPEKPAPPGAGARAGSTCHRSGYEPTSRARFRDARHSPQDDPLARGRRAWESRSRSLSTSSDGCSLARTPSGAKGRLTRSSAKRTAIRCTRGAFHP
jgi:hypothetical protein